MQCASCGDAVSGWSARYGAGGTILCKKCFGTEDAEAAIRAQLANESDLDQTGMSNQAIVAPASGIEYDQRVIKEFAALAYAQASAAEGAASLIGFVAGAVVGYLGGGLVAHSSGAALFVALASGVIGGVIGFQSGRAKALRLRLEAQVALCQVEIEKNTKVVQSASGKFISKPTTGHTSSELSVGSAESRGEAP